MLKKIVIILSLILWPLNMALNFNAINFEVNSIFKNDYQGEQLVLRNIHLYPNILMARTFQNKPRIYINKYLANFFVLTDLNNYFFALHPEPLPGNLNLFKYPFLDIVYFVVGIYGISKFKYRWLVLWSFLPTVLILSIFVKSEGFDFILWVPISLIIIHGVDTFQTLNRKTFNVFSIIFILFTIPEILRSFFNK